MTRRRTTLALVALAALLVAAVTLVRGAGREEPIPLRSGRAAGAGSPAREAAARVPAEGAVPSRPKEGWSAPPRVEEVNAAGLARAVTRREKERAPACEPSDGREVPPGCAPDRVVESAEIDWNGRPARP